MASSSHFNFSNNLSLEDIRQKANAFAEERDWNQFHLPRNLLLAMVGEVGELSEIFQWKGEVKEGVPDFTAAEREHLGQEMSDILIYLVRLADKCHVDLPTAVVRKMTLNGLKYPAHIVSGSSKKYSEYKNIKIESEET